MEITPAHETGRKLLTFRAQVAADGRAMIPTGAPAIRIWAAVTALYGAALVAAPAAAAHQVSGGSARPPAPVVRILGIRQIGQGAVLLARPSRNVALVAAAVDLLHAASMVVAALAFPAHRRSASISGAVAAVSAGVGVALGRPR